MTDGRRDLGGAVFLRPLQHADITERYVGWFRNPAVTRFLDARNITRADAIDHLERGRDTNAWEVYAICAAADARHVGNLKIGPIDWRHMTSDMVTVIGEPGVWGKGYGREALRIGIAIAFRELNMRKLSASIDSRNVGSIAAYTAAGFEIETALKNQFLDYSDGTLVLSDKVYVACFNPDFQPATAMR